jgi:ABC-type multidrug transport system fused ATPase/permease subunit
MKYAKEDATDEEIMEACKKACINDFILNLPSGLDTIIGEKGIKLSGGQRQRIALAKIFLKEADIYIFDEATSALDPHNETLIYDAIQQIAQDKTVIIVSHRESSSRICDKVINLDKLQQTLMSEEELTLMVN